MILKANKISKSYNHPKTVTILKDITFSLKAGESLAIIGPSGIGKTTLLHILGTLEKPTSGSLEILGYQVLNNYQSILRNEHIGFVFQNFNLLEEYSVLENVLMPAKVRRQRTGKGSQALANAEKMLKRVGLFNYKNQIAKSLSGGEKQRVAIARAFCNDPDLILADEPSGNLDESNSLLIHELLLQGVHDFGQSLIVVTHNISLAKLCDRTYLLEDGSLTSI